MGPFVLHNALKIVGQKRLPDSGKEENIFSHLIKGQLFVGA